MFSMSCSFSVVASKTIINSLWSSVPISSKKSILTYLCPRLTWWCWSRATYFTHGALCVTLWCFGGRWIGCTGAQRSAGRDQRGSDGAWWRRRRRSGWSPPGHSGSIGAPRIWWPPSNTWGGLSWQQKMTFQRWSVICIVQGWCGRGLREYSAGRGWSCGWVCRYGDKKTWSKNYASAA